MKWWEFSQDNGDGSFSKRRYRTKEEAEDALDWFNEQSWWQGDGDGVNAVDTECGWFFDTLEENKADYGRE